MIDLDSIKPLLLSVLEKYPVSRAAVFGSFSRNQQNSLSDVDLLVEFEKSVSIFDFLRMENELTKSVTRKVDVVEFSAIKSSIRNQVLDEAIKIL